MYIVMVYIVMAYVVMVYITMAYIVMAYIIMVSKEWPISWPEAADPRSFRKGLCI